MIFVNDEADCLLNEKGCNDPITWKFWDEIVVGMDMYKRIFRHFSFFWKSAWPVLISTNPKINVNKDRYERIYRVPCQSTKNCSLI